MNIQRCVGPLLLLGRRSARESRRKAKAVPLSQSCLAPSKNPMHMVIKSTWLPCHLHNHELNVLRRIDSSRSESNKQESGSKTQAKSIHLNAPGRGIYVFIHQSIYIVQEIRTEQNEQSILFSWFFFFLCAFIPPTPLRCSDSFPIQVDPGRQGENFSPDFRVL
jgi:hypothetical protein